MNDQKELAPRKVGFSTIHNGETKANESNSIKLNSENFSISKLVDNVIGFLKDFFEGKISAFKESLQEILKLNPKDKQKALNGISEKIEENRERIRSDIVSKHGWFSADYIISLFENAIGKISTCKTDEEAEKAIGTIDLKIKLYDRVNQFLHMGGDQDVVFMLEKYLFHDKENAEKFLNENREGFIEILKEAKPREGSEAWDWLNKQISQNWFNRAR